MKVSPDGLVEPLLTVGCDLVSVYFGTEELVHLLLQCGGAREETCGQPEKFPTLLFTPAEVVASQLLDNLTVDLVTKRLLRYRKQTTNSK